VLFDEVVGITRFEGYWICNIELFLCGLILLDVDMTRLND